MKISLELDRDQAEALLSVLRRIGLVRLRNCMKASIGRRSTRRQRNCVSHCET
jgi:hypothetical protein